jgi:micrococcal nuclease
MLDRAWSRFRGIPVWLQVILWLTLFWLLIPLLIWRSGMAPWAKVTLTIPFALLIVGVAASEPEPDFAAIDESISEPADDEETVEESETADDPTTSAPKRTRKSKEKVAATESTEGSSRHGPRALVARVIDGDTIEVVIRGRTVDVRLIGVDTPERVHPSEPVECFGPAASEFASSRLSGRTVQLDFDAERRDHYGRVLAYVWLNNQLFNRTLVARGFASVVIYEPNSEYATRLYAAESRAERRDKGMWGACSVSSDGDTQALEGGSGGSDKANSGGSGGSGNCDPNYEGACIPPYPPDLDCSEVSASGFRSVGSDPHGFDGDGDGVACE